MNADERPDWNDAEQTSHTLGADINAAEAKAKATDPNALAAKAVDAVNKAIEDLTDLLQSHAPGAAAALKDAGRVAGENIGGLARDLKDDAREIGRARLDDLSVAVKANPLTSLAIAAGLGLIVGLWNNRGGRQ